MLQAETWQEDLRKGFKEIFRVLKPYGVLLFKWSNHQIASHEIVALAGVQPLFYQVSMNKHRKYAKSGMDNVQTLWFCFMKMPEQLACNSEQLLAKTEKQK